MGDRGWGMMTVMNAQPPLREALPDAVLVADRFHTVALANDMLTQVRQQRVIRETQGRRGRKTDPERHLIGTRLDSFYQHAAATDAPEAHRLAATVQAWWPDIEAGILTGYSNARSEGYNRLAKHQGRNAFGFRNPINQRRRIRWACTRQHRRASAVSSTLPGQV
jgi:transposase